MIKKIVKNIIGSTSSSFNYPILVNSYGRSGSTVLTKSIINSSIKVRNNKLSSLALRSISQSAWDLESTKIKHGIVYKTHDYPPQNNLDGKVRILYTFADPVDVILSLLRLNEQYGAGWMKTHYDHLKVNYTNFEKIIEEDQLQLEKHLDTWLNEDRFDIAFIKYEAMWDHQNEISEFLGFDVELPPYIERKSKAPKDKTITKRIEGTYEQLRKKVKGLDDFIVK